MIKALVNKDNYVFLQSSFGGRYCIKKRLRRSGYEIYLVLIAAAILLAYAGCSVSWSPSDKEAVELVKGYYLFYKGGKEVNAEIISRGEFIKESKSYPVKLRIFVSENKSYEKTFYFFKNKSGAVDVREYKLGIN